MDRAHCGAVRVLLVGLIPFLGGLVELIVLLVGLGALSLALYNRYDSRNRSYGASGEDEMAATR